VELIGSLSWLEILQHALSSNPHAKEFLGTNGLFAYVYGAT
jgi:hypothetical protein